MLLKELNMKLSDILKNLNNKIKIEKPWGHELIWSDSLEYIGKIIFIKNDSSLSFQFHENKEETIYVLKGILTLVIGEEKEELTLNPGDSFKIPPLLKHRFASKNGEVTLIEVSSYFPNDVVRLEDKYGRS